MTFPSGITPGVTTGVASGDLVVVPVPTADAGDVVGRSPGQLMWRRFRRDKTGLASAFIVAYFVPHAFFAPLISTQCGKDPYTPYGLGNSALLNDFGYPLLPNGGISFEYWF